MLYAWLIRYRRYLIFSSWSLADLLVMGATRVYPRPTHILARTIAGYAIKKAGASTDRSREKYLPIVSLEDCLLCKL